MSFGNNYGGGRTAHGTQVYLNVYDLNPINDSCLYTMGLGLHHSGVEINGREYSFASEAGIFNSTPKEVSNAKFRESLLLGTFDGGESELRKSLSSLEDEFGPNDYNLIRKNCNHFANALCWVLLKKTIPPHVNRLADVGSCLSCLIPKKLLGDAPVNDNNHSSSTSRSSSGFQVYKRSSNSGSLISSNAFEGSGMRLGKSDSSSNTVSERSGLLSKIISRSGRVNSSSSNTNGDVDTEAKRERARLAALARFEKSNVE